VNGILDDMALGFDDGVAGIGGMGEGRGAVTLVGGIGQRESSCLGKLDRTRYMVKQARTHVPLFTFLLREFTFITSTGSSKSEGV